MAQVGLFHQIPDVMDITPLGNTCVFYTNLSDSIWNTQVIDSTGTGDVDAIKNVFHFFAWKEWNILVKIDNVQKYRIIMKQSSLLILPAKTMPCKNTRFVFTVNVPKVPGSRSPGSKTTVCPSVNNQHKIHQKAPNNVGQSTESAKPTTNEKAPCPVQTMEPSHLQRISRSMEIPVKGSILLKNILGIRYSLIWIWTGKG